MKYAILMADDPVKLTVIVQDAFDKGWTPLGGISVAPSPDGNGILFAQAVVKIEVVK